MLIDQTKTAQQRCFMKLVSQSEISFRYHQDSYVEVSHSQPTHLKVYQHFFNNNVRLEPDIELPILLLLGH